MLTVFALYFFWFIILFFSNETFLYFISLDFCSLYYRGFFGSHKVLWTLLPGEKNSSKLNFVQMENIFRNSILFRWKMSEKIDWGHSILARTNLSTSDTKRKKTESRGTDNKFDSPNFNCLNNDCSNFNCSNHNC